MEAERVPARLLDGLDESQRQAVLVDGGPLCILAPAGSGKTRVLTRRIARRVVTGDALPDHVLALTFTRKAAAELAGRLTALGVRDRVAAGTFNAVAFAQLRRRWADQGRAPWAVLDRPARLLAHVLGGPERGDAALAAAEVQWAKTRLVPPAGYAAAARAAGRRPPVDPDSMAAVYERYEEEKRRRRVVDFDDLLAGCARAMETDPAFAANQRWRFRHLFVDEFQDLNPLQLRLLEAWRDGRPDLCVVGDPAQAVYGWNGADPRYLLEFTDRWPGGVVVRLAANHRCPPQVLAAAAGVLRSEPPAATRPDGPLPTLTGLPGDREEAAAVAAAVVAAARCHPRWSDQAVLTRTRAQHDLLAGALRAAGVPVRVKASARLLGQPAVRDALAALEVAGGRAADAPAELRARADDADEAGEAERAERPDRAGVGGGSAGDALRALADVAGELVAVDPQATVDGLLAWLATEARGAEVPRRRDAVEVTTFHAAKGLEWPVVHVAGVEDGLVPLPWGDEDEERRLLHVALTRATEEVHVTWAERRSLGGDDVARSPSPFLDDLRSSLAALPDPAPVDWRREVAVGRARLRCRTDPVLVALEAWRADRARAAGVRPSAVLDDRTLAEVARHRPADLAALRGVPGVGPVRAARFGPALLEVVATRGRPRAS